MFWNLIFDPIAETLRLVGVGVLYLVGRVVKLFRPSSKTFTLKQIYRMDFGKANIYKTNFNKANQQATGALFLIGVLILVVLLR